MAAPELERLYDEHASALFALLLNFTRSEADTRDLFQEIFRRLAARPGLLSAALAELPAEQHVVVYLKLWEGLTFEAIAGTLDIPLNTAASRYRYGLDKLRARLRPLYDEIQ